MKNKGVTLVELLAVIVVISLIAILVYSNISRTLSDAKEDLSSVQVSSIKESTKLYVSDNVGKNEFFDSDREEVTLATLINEGYIEGSTYNILTNKDFNLDSSRVIITRSGEYPNYIYEYNLDMVDN